MVVNTNNQHVLNARRFVLEMMLARWPNVPILRKYAEEAGLQAPRFTSALKDDRQDACILCGLCVRACDEVVGASAISFADRGIQRRVATPFNVESEACIACGACALVCPTSHFTFEVEDHKGKTPEFLLGPNTAIYVPTLQSVPRVPVIDPESCIYFKTEGCQKCVEVCEPQAVNHKMVE